MAAIVHGSPSVTEDVEVFVRFDLKTVEGILRALEGTEPRGRMNVNRPPLGADPKRFVGLRNLYVETNEGVIDFLGELTGLPSWEAVAAKSLELPVADFSCRAPGTNASRGNWNWSSSGREE